MASRAVAVRTRTRTIVQRSRSRSRSGFKFPLLVVAGLAPGAQFAIEGFKQGGINNALTNLAAGFTGYDPSGNKRFTSIYLGRGLYPALIGGGLSLMAGKIGLNRVFGKLPIKF